MLRLVAGESAAGFWSYVHADDEAEDGRVIALAEKLIAEFGLISGGELELFVDRTSLRWGDAWKERIAAAISGTTFFMPIVTPRYFESEQCRKELLDFVASASRQGLSRLLLPIYYVSVDELEHDPTDEVMILVADRQWEDLREVRLVETDSAQFRQAVGKLAHQILQIVHEVASVPDEPDDGPAGGSLVPVTDPSPDTDGGGGAAVAAPGEPEGVLEMLATAEKILPELNDEILKLAEQITGVGAIAQDASTELQESDARGRGFAGRLRVTQSVASRLTDPAAEIRGIGQRFASDLVKTDPGVRAMLRIAADEIVESGDSASQDERGGVEAFANSVIEMNEATVRGTDALTELVGSLRETARLSRSLRPPLSDIEAGLRGVIDGREITAAWAVGARHLLESMNAGGEGAERPSSDDTDSDGR
jgi:TIR domain